MRIAVLGLGRMGAPVARNLAELGHEVTVYNRTPGRAGKLAASAVPTVAEAVAKAQVALTLVTGDAAEEALTFRPDGLLAHLAAGAVHLSMSDISVALSKRLAQAHAGAGQGYVAAPILGSAGGVPARHLWILAAGPDPQVNRCLPVFEALARGLTRVGPTAELAHALKLGASGLTAIMVEALAEVLAYGEKAGFPPADYLRLLNTGLFKSPLMDAYGGRMVRQDHGPAGPTLDLAAQDLDGLIEAAKDLGVAMPILLPLRNRMAGVQAQGLGSLDLTALAQARPGAPAGAAPAWPAPVAVSAPAKVRYSEPSPLVDPGPPSAPTPHGPLPPFPAEPSPVWLPSTPTPPAPAPELAGPTPTRPLPPLPDESVPSGMDRSSHFEEQEGMVWAWVDGARRVTPWRTLAELEQAMSHILFVRTGRHVLINPREVAELQPLFAGRSKVLMADGQVFSAGREATRRLRFLLGL